MATAKRALSLMNVIFIGRSAGIVGLFLKLDIKSGLHIVLGREECFYGKGQLGGH